MNSDLTIESELVSTPHDRQRRVERDIDKEDLKRARRYGMVENGRWRGCKLYHHAGRVLVYDERKNCIVTSYGAPSGTNKKAGTKKYTPVILKKSVEHDNRIAIKNHNRVKNQVLKERHKWKSHSVLVVDMSGSMRQDDVNGARCRSDGVWMVLARDFIMKKLEEENASVYDVVTIILMKEPQAEVFCRYEPITWVFYNKLIDLREWTTEKPSGGGCYLPALKKAEDMLSFNGKCPVLCLFFVSDGKPSDSPAEKGEIVMAMGKIASKFGRRLVVTCVGIADKRKEDFAIMKEMALEAKAFQCTSEFNAPDLSTTSLSSIIHSSNSSMTSTMTEQTDLRTGKLRTVRTDVLREKYGTPDDLCVNDQWNVFLAASDTKYTKNVYVWNNRMGDFATLINPRCCVCFKVVKQQQVDGQQGVCAGLLCSRCKACYACFECLENSHNGSGRFDFSNLNHGCTNLAHLRRNGLKVDRSLPSFSVAYKKTAFGEGAERLAFKLRFVAADGKTFLGPKMVAKESRFVETQEQEGKGAYLLSDRFSYHKQFMRTQAIASRFAGIYNRALDELPENAFTKQYPRIRFLDPVIIELEEIDQDGKARTTNILVEPMIEGTYRKFNTNNGKIGVAAVSKVSQTDFQEKDEATCRTIFSLLHRGKVAQNSRSRVAAVSNTQTVDLGVIEEGSEDEDDSECDDDCEEVGIRGLPKTRSSGILDELVSENADFAPMENKTCGKIRDEDFAQAFSHYSYVRSGGQLMVVDLQGTLLIKADKTREFVFTDPAIHKRKRAMGNAFLRQINLGRTNRGRQGMHDFWESHVCNDACRVLGLRPRPKYGEGVKIGPIAQERKVIWWHQEDSMRGLKSE